VVALPPRLIKTHTHTHTHTNMAYHCAMVHRDLLTCQAPTPHWGIAQPCHCKWGLRKDQGQRLSVLADCSIACRARRKLISLLYCRISYIHLKQCGS
jgi:hypothetical protein